ncbi:MAG: DUF2269 family protein [Shimia sp.]|uniref:DUF2269 family protein n=1 Tax=Shimia sp. TaxID=1954381 RepID=UPI00405829AF
MPNPEILAKCLHLIAMALMLGGTVINGLLHVQARHSSPETATALVTAVLRINRLLMLPALLGLPVSGMWLCYLKGYAFTDFWILAGIILSAALLLAYVLGARIEHVLWYIAKKATRANASTLPTA